MNCKIYEDYSDIGIAVAKQLFDEYAESLGFPLDFQDFDKELDNLPGEYSPPEGCILLLGYKSSPVGCIALRKIEGSVCEMKRMYVKPEFRGQGIGKMVAHEIIKRAREIGYQKMRLDTLESMEIATKLYKSMGFKEIEAYRYNPLEDAMYMELEL